MERKQMFGAAAAGSCAGVLNGLFGGGGGMLLIPMLRKSAGLEEEALFPTSVSVMLPVSVLSLALTDLPLPWADAWPYLLGSAAGGILVGLLGRKIPTLWLHRMFGALIVFGGVRYLWG